MERFSYMDKSNLCKPFSSKGCHTAAGANACMFIIFNFLELGARWNDSSECTILYHWKRSKEKWFFLWPLTMDLIHAKIPVWQVVEENSSQRLLLSLICQLRIHIADIERNALQCTLLQLVQKWICPVGTFPVAFPHHCSWLFTDCLLILTCISKVFFNYCLTFVEPRWWPDSLPWPSPWPYLKLIRG